MDGRESGPGADVPGCQLEAPTRLQIGLLSALTVMTIDFIVQEFRQVRATGADKYMFWSEGGPHGRGGEARGRKLAGPGDRTV